MYEKSAELFYSMISARIGIMRDFLKLTNKEIYDDDEGNLISAIIHNRKHPKKNPYLIPSDTARSTYPKDYVGTIAWNLRIKNENELLSGSRAEVEAYGGALFYTLILETLETDDDTANRIASVLMDYIPFSVANFYIEEEERSSMPIDSLIDPKFIVTMEEFFYERNMAVAHLYSKIEFEFCELIYNLFNEQANTYKLPKRLEKMVKEQLLPLIESTVQKRSFGNEAYRILKHSFERMEELFNYELGLSPETIGYHENERDYTERHIICDLAKLDAEHVDGLIRIQQEIEGQPNLDLLKDKWSSDMCI